jgi:hypothetical protein
MLGTTVHLNELSAEQTDSRLNLLALSGQGAALLLLLLGGDTDQSGEAQVLGIQLLHCFLLIVLLSRSRIRILVRVVEAVHRKRVVVGVAHFNF